MRVSEIMSSPVVTAETMTSIREASVLLRRHEIGALPVVEAGRVIGMVTDRDIVIAVIGGPGSWEGACVGDAMSFGPIACRDWQTITEAAATMGNAQVERLIVLDATDRLVGILSIGDIAVNASEVLAGQAMGEICEDRRGDKPGRGIRPRE